MRKRNILCLLLAAALLIQPISLRTWADEVTQQEEAITEEPTEAQKTEDIIEEPEEIQEPAEESEPEETLPEETEDWQEPEEDYEEDYEEVYEDGPLLPGLHIGGVRRCTLRLRHHQNKRVQRLLHGGSRYLPDGTPVLPR